MTTTPSPDDLGYQIDEICLRDRTTGTRGPQKTLSGANVSSMDEQGEHVEGGRVRRSDSLRIAMETIEEGATRTTRMPTQEALESVFEPGFVCLGANTGI